MQKQTKKVPKELAELVDLPDCMIEYWSWFRRLNRRRPSGMGVSFIPYSEMLDFFMLIGVDPDPCDIEVLEMFDEVAMKIFSEQQEKEQKRTQAKTKK